MGLMRGLNGRHSPHPRTSPFIATARSLSPQTLEVSRKPFPCQRTKSFEKALLLGGGPVYSRVNCGPEHVFRTTVRDPETGYWRCRTEILVLAGGVGAGGMAPPSSTRMTRFTLKCVQRHVSPVNMDKVAAT